MVFVPIIIVLAFLAYVFVKEERAFEKERKNPNRHTGFFKAPKMQTPSEIAQEAMREAAQEEAAEEASPEDYL